MAIVADRRSLNPPDQVAYDEVMSDAPPSSTDSPERAPIATYDDAVDWLMSFADFERGSGPRRALPDFALDRIRSLLRRLDDPQRGRITIHIAGSKGKGSTAAILESILRAAGYRTGLFTSPHLHSFTERIRVLSAPLPEPEFARLCEELRPIVEADQAAEPGHISTFEILTALGLHAFREHDVDVQIVEVGLGGRLDSTNVFARTDAVVITSLSHEHTDILGDHITQIAAEKAGIINAGCGTAVLAPQRFDEAADVVRDAADDLPVPLVDVGADYASQPAGVESWGQWFRLNRRQPRPGEPESAVHLLPLLGRHQIDNAVTAIAVIDTLNAAGTVEVGSESVHKGLATVHWPGRLESFTLPDHLQPAGSGSGPTIVIDGAHNPESVQHALDACREYFAHDALHVVVGVLGDKALADMARLIQTRSAHVYATVSDHPRARAAEQVAEAFDADDWSGRVSVHTDAEAALAAASAAAAGEDVILVLGSLSLAADARSVLTDTSNIPSETAPEAPRERRAEDPTL